MYSYTWDIETGGFLLNSTPLQFSKEPRPVYSKELDILGFDKYWKYDKDDSAPLMWAEANNYIYKGRVVAQTKGGSLDKKPEIKIIENPEPSGDFYKSKHQKDGRKEPSYTSGFSSANNQANL